MATSHWCRVHFANLYIKLYDMRHIKWFDVLLTTSKETFHRSFRIQNCCFRWRRFPILSKEVFWSFSCLYTIAAPHWESSFVRRIAPFYSLLSTNRIFKDAKIKLQDTNNLENDIGTFTVSKIFRSFKWSVLTLYCRLLTKNSCVKL